MRKFKLVERQFGSFATLAVGRSQLKRQLRNPVASLGVLRRECRSIDRRRRMQVEQPFLLSANLVKLMLNIADPRPALFLVERRAGDQPVAEPVADRLGLVEFGQHVDDLFLDVFLA